MAFTPFPYLLVHANSNLMQASDLTQDGMLQLYQGGMLACCHCDLHSARLGTCLRSQYCCNRCASVIIPDPEMQLIDTLFSLRCLAMVIARLLSPSR